MEEIKTLDLGDVTLAYKEIGTGDKYLLCSQNFFFENSHMARLGRPPYDYHVFLIYMRGYNKSTHITDGVPRNYTCIWGQDVIRFAEAMHLPSFYYTGISHGNWPGWYIAFHRPDMLRGMVCCNGLAAYMPRDPARTPLAPPRNLDEIVGNREALAKMAWKETWPTENPQRLATRASNEKEHLEILMGRAKEEFNVPIELDMSVCEAKSQQEDPEFPPAGLVRRQGPGTGVGPDGGPDGAGGLPADLSAPGPRRRRRVPRDRRPGLRPLLQGHGGTDPVRAVKSSICPIQPALFFKRTAPVSYCADSPYLI